MNVTPPARWHLARQEGAVPGAYTLCGKLAKKLRITASPDLADCTPCGRKHLREGSPDCPCVLHRILAAKP